MNLDLSKTLAVAASSIAVASVTALVSVPAKVEVLSNKVEHIEKELDESKDKQQQNREQLIRIEENTKYIKEALEKISK